MEASSDSQAWFLKSSCPVLLPAHDALTKTDAEFDAFLVGELSRRSGDCLTPEPATADKPATEPTESETFTLVSESTSAEIRENLAAMDVDAPSVAEGTGAHPFIQGLVSYQKGAEKDDAGPDTENKMLTENADEAHRSTTSDLVDLFTELEDVISGPRLIDVLGKAWSDDPLSTLKIIFNARSIHLGKSSRSTFYRAAGWLATNHPLTLVANLRWLSRPVIEKKAKKEGEEDAVLVEGVLDENDPMRFDVKYGVAHGYWKDLLNILVLAVSQKLTALSDPRDVLNSENPGIRRGKTVSRGKAPRRGRSTARGRRSCGGGTTREAWTERQKERDEIRKQHEGDPKAERREVRARRHRAAVEAFNSDSTYRALHLTVARLFAEQLQADLKALRGSDTAAKKAISLCGKWAPSSDRFHDKHTLIVSSIAEIMYPRESLDKVLSPTDDRETYLRYAREEYRKDTSALRKHLDVVERKMTANDFGNIKYDRVPSLAMKNYSKLFIEKDFDHFEKYIDDVAQGKAKISGATLLPSTLIHSLGSGRVLSKESLASLPPSKLIEYKTKMMEQQTIDGQWRTLVQRIKDSGKLSSSIAVCDVSGSMSSPLLPDGTRPMDSAVGLSLLVAEVTEPPFGGAFITFSASPKVERVDLSEPLSEKVAALRRSSWSMNTDFVAVFEKLILPMALAHRLKPEDMVKRVFVFSDMQFDAAEGAGGSAYVRGMKLARGHSRWSTSYERIKKAYSKAGYEMPKLIFWNLAGGRAGHTGSGDPVAPKPVTTTDKGTSLVSGYSQGMLKVFLENGSFEEEEEESEDEVVVSKEEDDETVTATVPKKKVKTDLMRTVRKAIGHTAYDMLKVLD